MFKRYTKIKLGSMGNEEYLTEGKEDKTGCYEREPKLEDGVASLVDCLGESRNVRKG
jgi:hypothetical protein